MGWNSKIRHVAFSRLERETLCPGATQLASKKPRHQTQAASQLCHWIWTCSFENLQVLEEKAFTVS